MSIVYTRFNVSLHGLNISSLDELEALRSRIEELVKEYHPAGASNILDSDVEVEIDEYAGAPNK